MAQDFTRKQVAALEKRYDFKTAKSLGQNFVTDPAVTEGIIEAAGAGPKDLVIEGRGRLRKARRDRDR